MLLNYYYYYGSFITTRFQRQSSDYVHNKLAFMNYTDSVFSNIVKYIYYLKQLFLCVQQSKQCLSEIEIFCYVINVFIITFEQFKASSLSINFYNFVPIYKQTPSF